MKKFVLLEEYLEKIEIGYKAHNRKPIAVANDLNSLMKTVENCAQRTLQVRNPGCLAIGKWDVQTNGSHAEIIIAKLYDDEDAVHFIIDEVDFILD
jgi:hypothetical protein